MVWKAKSLSIGNHFTLLKYVLGSLGSYFKSVFPTPLTVIHTLEYLRARFYWGIELDESGCIGSIGIKF